jgi:hypothetical protein
MAVNEVHTAFTKGCVPNPDALPVYRYIPQVAEHNNTALFSCDKNNKLYYRKALSSPESKEIAELTQADIPRILDRFAIDHVEDSSTVKKIETAFWSFKNEVEDFFAANAGQLTFFKHTQGSIDTPGNGANPLPTENHGKRKKPHCGCHLV